MNDTILIPPDRLQPGVIQYVESSALASCTSTETRDDGSVAITSAWPVAGFSSGEVVAWALLRSLVEGDLRRLIERCDTDTIGALIAGLAIVHTELVSA